MQIVEIDHVLHRPVRQRVRDVPEVLRLAASRRSHLRTIEKPVDKDELLHVAPRPASFAQFKQFQRTIAVLLARDRYSSFHVSTIYSAGRPGSASASRRWSIYCYDSHTRSAPALGNTMKHPLGAIGNTQGPLPHHPRSILLAASPTLHPP